MGLVRGQTGHAREVSALAKVVLLIQTAKKGRRVAAHLAHSGGPHHSEGF